MTREQEEDVKQYLKAKGLNKDCISGAIASIRFHEATERLRDAKDVRRGRDIMKFKPNPGKAKFTPVGETQTYLGGDNHGLPIYQEDVDMIKKALPLAKRLVELQKTRPQEPEPVDTLRTLRDTIDEVYDIDPQELNMGPDTTENIHEIGDNYPGAGDWKEWRAEHADVLGQMREEDIRDSGDVMFGVDIETQGLQGNVDPLMSRQFLERYREPIVLGPNPVITPGKCDDEPYPTTAEMKNYIDEQRNKNVSQDEDKKDPGDYYTYSNILKRMDDTHTRKNNDYGDAAYQGFKKYGPAYFLVQLHNKLSRLESLTINNKTQMVKDESIDDTLLDMANYAVMYLESRHRDD